MKKVFFTMIYSALCQFMFAQETLPENFNQPVSDQPKSEVSVSAGVLPIMCWANFIADVFTAPISGGYESTDLNVVAFNASYGYHVVDKVVVGGAVGYANITKKYTETSSNLAQSYNYLTVMPYAKVNWVNLDHFCFYSRVAVGPCFEFAKQTKNDGPDENSFQTYCLFQISPAGFEWGGINFRGFGEIGIGQEGLMQMGFRYRF